MKKKFIFTVLLSGFVLLTGCECKHKEWTEATCSSPKTCVECGATEGEALEHKWEDATCEKLKTCSVCGTTEGELAEHKWEDATIQKPKTCSVCGKTEGNVLSSVDVLSDEEKELYEAMIDLSCTFKNPSSMRLLKWDGTSFCVISGENSFGGTVSSAFFISNKGSLEKASDTFLDLDNTKKESVSKINRAISEYFNN